MPVVKEGELKHYGILRRSGRYPWRSGKTPYQRSIDMLARVQELEKQGMTPREIADFFGIGSTNDLRAAKAIAKNQIKAARISEARILKDKGMSQVEIGERMGLNESSVRALLSENASARNEVLATTASMLRKRVAESTYVDVGLGSELEIGIAKTKLDVAVKMLKDEGYTVEEIYTPIVGQQGKFTKVKVLAPPGTAYSEISRNRDKIQSLNSYTEDYGHSYTSIVKPQSVSAKRLQVRYGSEGGSDMDGVIELRPGVADLSLAGKRYAQVRISVDDTHFIKGMAVYSDDLPAGVDIRFNTNKSPTGNKKDALKPLESDPEGPFGAIVRQRYYSDAKGNKHLSAINVVGSKEGSNEEGGWDNWSRTLSSQFLSKQTTTLARRQLDLDYDNRKLDYDEILSIPIPAVRKKLLLEFADSADSAATDLKAAALPRQANRVLLPVPSLRDHEVYAPGYNNGERVVLIRHPHGGRFEIPELVVNNRNPKAIKNLGNVMDAIGVNPSVAKKLSGADFDGDTVVVIPNNSRLVKSQASLRALKDFDPVSDYPGYPGMREMSEKTKQIEMGKVSNLISDMTLRGASESEIARAVKHSMVVIDAEKHKLNYRQSEQDHGISSLRKKYQSREGSSHPGASTLISRAGSKQDVPDFKPRGYKDGGPIDPATGEKVYVPTGKTKLTYDKKGNLVEVPVTVQVSKMSRVKDARTLSSGTAMEEVYAGYANKVKSIANQARRDAVRIEPAPQNPTAKKKYAAEVSSLAAKLNTAEKNKPRERKAQLLAGSQIRAAVSADPNLRGWNNRDALKKVETRALIKARAAVGANKTRVNITEREWEAIKSGAVSNTALTRLLGHTEPDVVKQYAMPRTKLTVPDYKVARAKLMLANGYTQAEVAAAMGVPASTLNYALHR